jgi:hypothetical protein
MTDEDTWSESEKDAVRRVWKGDSEMVDFVLKHCSPNDTAADMKARADRHKDLAEAEFRDAEQMDQLMEYYKDDSETLKEVWPRLPEKLKIFVKRYEVEHPEFFEDEPHQ